MPVAFVRLLYSFAAVALAVVSVPAFAAAQRTFVSSTGADASTCSLVAPCRTFTRALTQTSAKGEVVVLDSAAYGPVTITQSVSIIAPAGIYAGISVFTGDGVTINAGVAGRVVLRGLVINGQGGSIGINFAQGALVRVENCVISNMASNGVQHTVGGGELIVLDSIVRDNGGAGILMYADGNLLLDGVRVEHNAGDGVSTVATTGTASAHIRNSVMSYNGQGGIAAIRPSLSARTNVAIESSTMTGNAGDGVFAGGIAEGTTDVSLTRSTISGNHLSGVSVFDGYGPASAWVRVHIFENLFTDNLNFAVKTDGAHAVTTISKDTFGGSLLSFLTLNGGLMYTFTDNSGEDATVGPSPLPYPRF